MEGKVNSCLTDGVPNFLGWCLKGHLIGMDDPTKEDKVVKGWLDRMLHMGQFAVKGKHDFLGIDKRKLTGMLEQGMKEACGICLPRSERSSSRGVWRCQSGSRGWNRDASGISNLKQNQSASKCCSQIPWLGLVWRPILTKARRSLGPIWAQIVNLILTSQGPVLLCFLRRNELLGLRILMAWPIKRKAQFQSRKMSVALKSTMVRQNQWKMGV